MNMFLPSSLCGYQCHTGELTTFQMLEDLQIMTGHKQGQFYRWSAEVCYIVPDHILLAGILTAAEAGTQYLVIFGAQEVEEIGKWSTRVLCQNILVFEKWLSNILFMVSVMIFKWCFSMWLATLKIEWSHLAYILIEMSSGAMKSLPWGPHQCPSFTS